MSNDKVTLVIAKGFKFAHRGVEVREYVVGETVETDDPELVRVATENGWASQSGEKPKGKAKSGAPENKDAASQSGENKAAEP
jgi:hypothetical protein